MLTFYEIAAALQAPVSGADFSVTAVVTDSRKATAGCLFAALEGERVDGHSFISQLDQQFSPMLFIGTKPMQTKNPYILVSDVRKALGLVAKAYLATLPAKVIGVTGSVGKTTTKNFILSALQPAMQVSGTAGNMNNELGVPLTALAVRPEDRAAVIEMGMRGLGQIEYLTRFITPDVAVITNIGVAHLELLGTRENIARAKLELVDALQGGTALLNGDEPLLRNCTAKPCRYFGLSEGNDYRAVGIIGSTFTLCYPEGELPVTLQVAGEHQIMNALAAFGVGHILGVEPALLKEGLESFCGDGRRQFTETVGGVTVIDDTYNASPDSMRAALKVLACAKGRKIAVLGDMLELGSYEEEGHRAVGRICAELGIDTVVAVGQRAALIHEAAEGTERYYVSTREEALPLLEKLVCKGDTLLFKASNSMGFDRLANGLKERMKKQ